MTTKKSKAKKKPAPEAKKNPSAEQFDENGKRSVKVIVNRG